MVTGKNFIPVVCAIIEHGDTVLAAKRGGKTTNAGLWEFPGGKVDGGELPADALKREIWEELGIVIDCGQRLQSVFFSYPWIDIELIPFISSIKTGEPVAHEHEAICYMNKAELHTIQWAPADLLVIEKYFQNNE